MKLSTSTFFPEKVDGFANFTSRGTSDGYVWLVPPAPSPTPIPPTHYLSILSPFPKSTRKAGTPGCGIIRYYTFKIGYYTHITGYYTFMIGYYTLMTGYYTLITGYRCYTGYMFYTPMSSFQKLPLSTRSSSYKPATKERKYSNSRRSSLFKSPLATLYYDPVTLKNSS